MKDNKGDASLERVLGSSLRGSLREGSDACPDAETLAAWSENGLAPHQRRQLEAHLASCARCQAQMAALVRSDVSPEPSPARVPGWLSWRWLVPAAAGVTALALWIVIQPRPAPESSPTPAAKVAAPPAAASAPARDAESRADARSGAAASSAIAPRAAVEPPAPSAPSAQAANEAPAPAAPPRAAASGAAAESKVAKEEPLAPAAAPATQSFRAAADSAASAEIVSSDPSVRWRIRGADVERTVDGGATWTRQPTGTTVPLTAGASPASSVCWIVGRRGTVLRSIDGHTWQAVSFPEAIDLVGVEAAGPAEATVTTVDARHFTTRDGGTTWR